MTEQQHRALARLDPALAAQQRCLHDWRDTSPEDIGLADRLVEYTCLKCGEKRRNLNVNPELPAFGDGVTRYGSVDELLALCRALKIYHKIERRPNFSASTIYRAQVSDPKVDGLYPSGYADSPADALVEAILKAFGGGLSD